MEAPKDFKIVIKKYLDQRAVDDKLFAATYAKPGKSVDDCCRYILGEARKRGTEVVMKDDEVFGLAVHYYDEDNVKIGGSGKCDVSVGGQTTLTKPINQQPSFKRGKAKKEENKLQLSLFD